jgi:hypothetical protein
MARRGGRGKQQRVERARNPEKPIGPAETRKPTDEELEALKPTKEEVRRMRTDDD